MGLRRIVKNFKKDGFDGLYYRFLSLLNLNKTYKNLIEKKKYFLGHKISKIANNKIIHGPYKNTYLSSENGWGMHDFASKFLGLYEEQIQLKIVEIQKKYNLEYLINFGASDGFHVLGLLNNHIFKEGLAFEIDSYERSFLHKNIEKNNLSNKIKVLGKGTFEKVFEIIESNKLSRSLFLIDIEGGEFDLFNSDNISRLNKSYFIIEKHDFWEKDAEKKKNYYTLLRNNFDIEIIKNSGRNPFIFDFISDLSDDERWLILSEGRPCEMEWLLLIPK
tara:strand:- start:1801 stop:2628 length:828 start_codon:yes stop_codon:yes gene_type:complete